MPENYTITTIELGLPSGAQVVEEAENSFQALRDRMVRKEEKYKRLKKEHRALVGYVRHLARLCAQENPAMELPLELPQESISGLEEMKKAIQGDKWIGSVRTEAERFIVDLVSSFQSASSILSCLENIDQAWNDTHIFQDKTIPRLATLMRVPMQTLVDEGVIQAGDRYDFPGWYSVAFTGQGFFDTAKVESAKIRKAMGNIHEGILNTLEALFAKRLTPEEVEVDRLKERLQPFFSKMRVFA